MIQHQYKDVEIMAPAGSWESLRAAIQAKADSIYFGMDALNMRAHSAHNFTLEELPEVIRICKEGGVKAYVTLNAIIYDEDLPVMRNLCQHIRDSGAEAVIASDVAVLEYARSIGLPVHISTQQNVCNLEAVRFFAKFSDVIVLARELTLEQIRIIRDGIVREQILGPSGHLVRIELFVHGAICVAVSGKCYMSLMAHNESANRGKCTQVCRRKYRVIDEQTQSELVLDNQYVMSPKDLCTIDGIDQILDAGVSVLKIEGRGKAAEYVYTVVKAYREAVTAVQEGTFTQEKKEAWKERLKSVYNRGFWEGGYYLGQKMEEWSASSGSQATEVKTLIGKVTNYFSNLQVAEIKLESGRLKSGNRILIIGPTTGVADVTISSLHESSENSCIVTCPMPSKVRKNDRVYLVEERKLKVV